MLLFRMKGEQRISPSSTFFTTAEEGPVPSLAVLPNTSSIANNSLPRTYPPRPRPPSIGSYFVWPSHGPLSIPSVDSMKFNRKNKHNEIFPFF